MDLVAQAMTLIADDANANQEKAKEIVKGLTDKYPLYK